MLNKQKGRFRQDSRIQFASSVLLAVILMLILSVVEAFFPEIPPLACGLIFTGAYIVIAGSLFALTVIRYHRLTDFEASAQELNTEVYDMFKYVLDIPYAIVNPEGIVKIVNGSLQEILNYRAPVCNVNLAMFCTVSIQDIAKAAKANGEVAVDINGLPVRQKLICPLGGKRYELLCYTLRTRGQEFYFVVFNDISDYLNLQEKTARENPVVAYIVLDNLQEIAQYVRASYRSATTEIENILYSWANEVHGLIREYDRDKYLMLFSAEELDLCEKNNFPILDTIRNVRLGDNSFPVTISVGIAAIDGTMEEREKAASSALDVALQRGGDQVVLRRESGLRIFGGRVNTIQSNTAIPSRVHSNQLCSKIADAGNIIIMGHRNPDFDAFGAAVGIARLAISVKGDSSVVRIVTNTTCSAFEPVKETLAPLEDYKGMFIDAAYGLDLVRSDTLLIVVDVNNMKIVEAPDIAQAISTIAIIDHHRQFEEFTFQPTLSYIHPTASSTCELVAEMLEQSPYDERLLKEEATVLLAGIMLDTKNFTHNTGSQTFSAIHYLYERGAHTNVSRLFFNEDIQELLSISDFGTKARIYRDIIAITWADHTGGDAASNRIFASKAADNLLTLKGIDATFALVKIGDVINISARSNNRVNVQLILEKLGGGGHFDMAGAQVRDASLPTVLDRLKDVIDDYLDNILLTGEYHKPTLDSIKQE